MKPSVIELVTYQLKSGVNVQQLAETHEGVHEFLKEQPGFIYRSLSQDESGQWFDIVYWQDIATAKSAGDAFMAAPAGQALGALADMDSVVMRHMVAEAEMMGDCEGSA
ncbi:MAG: hypothetical protein OQK12_10150 [Motiliproteus sp.]|nr:hypothetical protein [Motiliproteus sp.]MCW9051651.1 hypothetical protein [Motiliproteus sp.]